MDFAKEQGRVAFLANPISGYGLYDKSIQDLQIRCKGLLQEEAPDAFLELLGYARLENVHVEVLIDDELDLPEMIPRGIIRGKS